MDDQQVQQHMETEQAAEVAAPEEQVQAVETTQGEPAPAAEATDTQERREPDKVPLAVHLRQRERFERQLAEQQQRFEIGQQRLEQIARQLAPKAPEPDPDDILGRQLHELQEVKQTLGHLTAQQQQEREQRQAREQLDGMVRAVKQDEAVFIKDNPDYVEAINHAKAVKRSEYMALGLSEQQANARLQADAIAIAQQAYQIGESPAALAYRLADALGYRKSATTAEAAPTNVLAMRQQGQRMATGGGGGGGNKGTIPSFAELASMSNEAFEAATKGGNWQKIMGG